MRPTDEDIVSAAKTTGAEKGFCYLVQSRKSSGVNSPYGIGFIEGAVWCRRQFDLKPDNLTDAMKALTDSLKINVKINVDDALNTCKLINECLNELSYCMKRRDRASFLTRWYWTRKTEKAWSNMRQFKQTHGYNESK